MTDAQRAAAKPWAIVIFAWKSLYVLAMAGFLFYFTSTGSSDTRTLVIVISSLWLISHGLENYCIMRLYRIIPSPPKSSTAQRGGRVAFVVMSIILLTALLGWWP